MHTILDPSLVDDDGLTEQAQDKTAPQGMLFFHAKEGQPLSTPWQVATARSAMLKMCDLPKGLIVDCACGSGLQLAAHASILQRPALGIELSPQRAQASAKNMQIVARQLKAESKPWFKESRILAGDGTDASGALEVLRGHVDAPVALLHLDPARPRNSRTHGLDEMQPSLDDVFAAWTPYFAEHPRGPALLLDLSPRLTTVQRNKVEALVDNIWPGLGRTWVWTSRGRGRVDRLALWLGAASSEGVARRFVRIPPRLGDEPLVLSTALESDEETFPKPNVYPPKRGEYVSILDAALLESGLVSTWLEGVSKEGMGRWASVDGRRPQLHHDHPLQPVKRSDNLLIQATGKVVALIREPLSDQSIDGLVEIALEHNMKSLTLRLNMDPADQPKWQGSLDRQLSRRHGERDGFVAQHPSGDVLLLCVCHSES